MRAGSSPIVPLWTLPFSGGPCSRWLGLAVLSLGVSMIIVDATVVNVVIPAIIGDLGLPATDAERAALPASPGKA